jgi:transposase
MGYRKISRDCKIAAIRLFERHLLPLEDILECCGFSERTWYRILKLWNETGDVVKPGKTRRGRIRNLDKEDVQYLLRLVRQNPDYFLDELLHLLKTNRFISVHYTTIHRELERAGMSTKKLKRIALERDEERRADFIARMAQYSPEEIGFLDETSKDERTVGRRRGRSKKGKRAERKQPFVRGRRTSTEALLTLDGIVSGTVVEGSMTKAGFLEYLEFNVVCPITLLLLYPTDFAYSSQNALHIRDP